ncbi:MAG: 6-carboxytetrahydropterin synthase [Bacteroidales bacterium]|jgi:6-pyruvoyltetrahydropterin/6-carboxytetrahydropterin synthase|nr:6-carboxytetrahydropterin synthase [Bacteroidales bacterium]
MIIRITKEFTFEASHALDNYDGLCKNIHGHSYKLLVTLKGEPVYDENSPKLGMIMDFADLKKIVKQEILDSFDHAIVLKNDSRFINIKDTKIVFVPYQPTCENMLSDFVKRISTRLPKNIILSNIKLYETATSCAEWRLEDNFNVDY